MKSINQLSFSEIIQKSINKINKRRDDTIKEMEKVKDKIVNNQINIMDLIKNDIDTSEQ